MRALRTVTRSPTFIPQTRPVNRTEAHSTSRGDPNARLRSKPEQQPHLVQRGQVAVDPLSRCVVACLGDRADGQRPTRWAPIVDRALCLPQLKSVGPDPRFAAEPVTHATHDRGSRRSWRPQRTMLPTDRTATHE